MYQDAKKPEEQGGNGFHIIELDYWEHPEYNDDAWVKLIRNSLGEKGFAQEILRDFGGGGNSFIPAPNLEELDRLTSEIVPIRVLLPELANRTAISRKQEDIEKGALYIWREPIPGREYILGFDASAGMGDENDNSSFQVVDALTCEQVAEFYSNITTNRKFATIIAQVGTTYNTALVIGEDDKWGHAVLGILKDELFYENLYYVMKSNTETVGISPSKKIRPVMLEILQSRILAKSVSIRSRRLVYELRNFVYNNSTKTPQADKGYHDDAIMAFGYALYARENSQKYLPAGAVVENINELTDRFKIDLYEEIKAELSKGAPEEWFAKKDEDENPLDIDWKNSSQE
jgi:hypothetical protein